MFRAAFPAVSERPALKPSQLSSTHFTFPVSQLSERPLVLCGCPFCRPSSALQLHGEYNHFHFKCIYCSCSISFNLSFLLHLPPRLLSFHWAVSALRRFLPLTLTACSSPSLPWLTLGTLSTDYCSLPCGLMNVLGPLQTNACVTDSSSHCWPLRTNWGREDNTFRHKLPVSSSSLRRKETKKLSKGCLREGNLNNKVPTSAWVL